MALNLLGVGLYPGFPPEMRVPSPLNFKRPEA